MRSFARRSVALVAVAFLTGLTVACTANVEGSEHGPAAKAAELADGLTILEADASVGKLVAAFKQGGRVITFHLRLGPKMESIAEADRDRTDIPTYEIDGIVRDQEGRAMTTQIGGDQFIDPTWVMMERHIGIDSDVRAADFARAIAAETAFAVWSPPVGLEQLRLGALQLTHASRDLDREKTAATALPAGDGVVGVKQNYVNPSGDPYSYYDWTYSMWQKDVASVFGEHSAVRLSLYSSGGTFIANWETCNHGSCAAASSMNKACVSGKFRDADDTRYIYAEYSTSTDSGRAGCTNPYEFSGSESGKEHNCHNDSRLQRYAIVTGPVGDASRAGNYGSLCAQSDHLAPDSCPMSF